MPAVHVLATIPWAALAVSVRDGHFGSPAAAPVQGCPNHPLRGG
jgi:hypothetical protein